MEIDGQTPRPWRPTIKDVAKKAGVHFSTVSQALHGHPRVAAETRQAVLQAASELGYQPSDAMRALSRFRSRIIRPDSCRIGFLRCEAGTVDPSTVRLESILVAGAAGQARALGFELEEMTAPIDADPEKILDHMARRRVSAVIQSSFSHSRQRVPVRLPWDRVCGIGIGRGSPEGCPGFVAPDEKEALRECMAQLRSLGYSRLGLVTCRSERPEGALRNAAVFLIEERSNLRGQPIPILLLDDGAPDDDQFEQVRRWSSDHGVGAIVSATWRPPANLMTRAGCPGFASLLITEDEDDLAGVRFDLAGMGARAVTLLASRVYLELRDATQEPVGVYLQGVWRGGVSAPPVGAEIKGLP